MGHARDTAHKQQRASTIPTLMAITISNSTVSDMHISITTMSSFGAWRSS